MAGKKKPQVASDNPAPLRLLSPTYASEDHGDYVEILKRELNKSGVEAPLNIALTGHYGSGKSSVLMETKRALEPSLKVINLSLPSLGVGDGRIPENGNKALDTTNLIQKEIVKQLLYRQKPSDMPASRYSRLDTFHAGRALPAAAGVGVAATAIALLAKVPEKVRDALPTEAWSWVNHNLWWKLAGPIQWSSLLLVFVLTLLAALWAQRLLQQRIRVTELAAGPTKVTLSDSSSSYFDEYLDEIVYFFQTSKTAVVIFEDLDRFKDPHIFETLRELNLLLNNAEQTGKAPIRFVYAIRDSIFEQLDIDSSDEMDEMDESTAALSSDIQSSRPPAKMGHEKRRLTSTNRTKFFDLVVPMVPFISHRTSRDLIRRELKVIPVGQRPQPAVIDIVGAHLTDMRLIKNICNEYEVFRRQILAAGGLEALTPDRLFSSIVYKNLYLLDYENIRHGTSPLDTLYEAYREWVRQHTASARSVERLARARLRRIDAVKSRSEGLGARLQAVLSARHVSNLRTDRIQLILGGNTYVWGDLLTTAFWESYLKGQGPLEIRYQPGYAGDVLAFDKIRTLMGYHLTTDDWTEEDKRRAAEDIIAAEADQRTIQHATMADALFEVDRLFRYQGKECSFADVAEEIFGDSPLVLELLNTGLIDENFTLYVTQFPGQAISASAMNFIIKSVQPDAMDIEYHFGTGEEVESGDIEAVLEAEENRLLGGQSVFNVELFDYLFAKNAGKLDGPIRRLAAAADSDQAFIEAYLTSGKYSEAFVKGLSASWPNIFAYLMGEPSDVLDESLLDAALSGVNSQRSYSLSIEQKAALGKVLPRLATVTTPQPEGRSREIATTIAKMGIGIDLLGKVAQPLREELVKRHRYPVTLGNLRTILGAGDSISLDRIKRAREADVYPHVLDNLGDYLAALDEATKTPSISSSGDFIDVMSDIGEGYVAAMEDVARRASAECVLLDVQEVDASLWPVFAAAHRLALTAQNVASYIAEHGVDSELANWLGTAGVITVDATDPTALAALALKLLNATALGDDVTMKLVRQLDLDPGSIAAKDLKEDAHSLLPALVRLRIVADDEDAYMVLGDDEWPIKEDLISTSEAFPTYMESLELSTKDLFYIATRPVPEGIKDAVVSDLSAFGANLGPKGAEALASRAAAGTGRAPTPDTIVTLATKAGSSASRPILRLLGEHAQTMEIGALKQALSALGEPYDQLTEPGRDRPKVPTTDGTAKVLARLASAGIVSKFVENSKKQVFEVSKRHS